MNEDRKFFKGILDGVEKELEVLFTFRSNKTNKDYIIYTDNLFSNDSLNIYASIYYPEEPNRELEKIRENSDWNEVELFLKEVGLNGN